jgi:hypothetical protein
MYNDKYPKCEQELNECMNNIGGRCFCLSDTHFNRPCPFFKEKDKKHLTKIPANNITGEKYIVMSRDKFMVQINRENFGRYSTIEDAIFIRNRLLEEMSL